MKILVLNGSPRGPHGNTQRLVTPFLEGARAQGAEASTLHTCDLRIQDCRGCFGCWTKTPGRCVQRDDMDMVLDAMLASDALVFASPLYHFGITASLKRLLERTLPLAEPEIVQGSEGCRHPKRHPGNQARWLWIMNCGFPDHLHFDAALAHFRALDRARGVLEPTDAILCTAGEMLRVPETEPLWRGNLDAVRQCGVEFVRDGRISSPTLERASAPFVDVPTFCENANRSWARMRQEPGPERFPS